MMRDRVRCQGQEVIRRRHIGVTEDVSALQPPGTVNDVLRPPEIAWTASVIKIAGSCGMSRMHIDEPISPR
jgi:hypothetical protein